MTGHAQGHKQIDIALAQPEVMSEPKVDGLILK